MTTTQMEPVYFLLVDDLEENLLALEGLLRREGLILLKAKSGIDALEFLLKHDVALAFIDIQMPGMDGFELAEVMRNNRRTRRVPIIFLTAGETDRKRRFQGYEAGAVDFLQKPLEPHILKSKADVFFDLFRQRQEVSEQRDELKTAADEITRLLHESRQYSQALKEADQRKDDFLAMLAHELRNPLAPVRTAVEILKLNVPTKETITHAAEIISRQVTHMSRLVDDLLDVARISRGKIQLRTEPCDLAAVVRHTAEDYRPTFTQVGITLNLSISERPLFVMGDPIRIAQVVGNLLHNASKFTPSGGIVDVYVSSDDDQHEAIVTVRDNGLGLDPIVFARLFEPFSQADQKLDRDKGGLGLGLALVKGLIELHGGTVSAASDGPGKGATFTVRLPLTQTDKASNEAATAASSDSTPLDRLRILLVEDNRDAATTLQLLLQLLGYEVAIAFDATDGLRIAQEFCPHVVISDLGLPGSMDGFALAHAVRADPSLSKVFLIALTGYSQVDDRNRAAEAGFDQHLVKPVDTKSLEVILQTVRNRRE